MKASELRGRDVEDLTREVENLRRELFELRLQWQAEEEPDSSRRQLIRRDIARCLTVIREKQMEQKAAGN